MERGRRGFHVFNHTHEMISGRTSSIVHQILGFNTNGECVNDLVNDSEQRNSWGDIIDQSCKVISFLDLAGHEKYLKTTVSGMVGHMPDYCMIVVGATTGVTKITKEHYRLTLSFKIPVIFVVTKIDICSPKLLKKTMDDIQSLVKISKRKCCIINNDEEVIYCIKNMTTESLIPVFLVSNVTGENLNLLKPFLNMLQPRIEWDSLRDKPSEVSIDSVYNITGVGTVVTGIVLSGTIFTGQDMLLGPNEKGEFVSVKIKSIQSKRIPVQEVHAGRMAGFALTNVNKDTIRKGMVLTSMENNPRATWSFEAQIVVLPNSSTIRKNREPFVQGMNIKQTAKIVTIFNRETLKTGDQATVRFQFKYRPEYIQQGIRIILREGGCKAIGVVSKILYDEVQVFKRRKLRKLFLFPESIEGEVKKERTDRRKRLKSILIYYCENLFF